MQLQLHLHPEWFPDVSAAMLDVVAPVCLHFQALWEAAHIRRKWECLLFCGCQVKEADATYTAVLRHQSRSTLQRTIRPVRCIWISKWTSSTHTALMHPFCRTTSTVALKSSFGCSFSEQPATPQPHHIVPNGTADYVVILRKSDKQKLCKAPAWEVVTYATEPASEGVARVFLG